MKAIINGVEVTYNKDTKVVGWMSDWTKCWDLAREGYLDSNYYPQLYGHVDFKVVVCSDCDMITKTDRKCRRCNTNTIADHLQHFLEDIEVKEVRVFIQDWFACRDELLGDPTQH